MGKQNTVLTLSWIILVATLLVLVVSLNKYGITGFSTSEDTAAANLSITEQASLRFTTSTCNFGSGSVGEENHWAMAWSNGTSINTTGDSGFQSCTTGLVLQNDGDIDLNVTLGASNEAAAFIGGSSPSMKWKSTNDTTCKIAGTIDTYTEISGSANVCGNLTYNPSGSGGTVTIDFELKIPENAIGTKGTVITATGTSI